MKIVCFEIEEWEKALFHKLELQHELIYTTKPLNKNTLLEHADADIVSTFIYSDLGSSVLAELKNLKLICTRSTGYDHIDLDFCKKQGVTVTNVPTYGENTVAEHVFALLLTISHRILDSVDRTRRGDFSSRGLQGFDLCNKTIGVIGTGRIGCHVIRMSAGFEMNVIAYDAFPDSSLAETLGFTYVNLPTLLSNSDIITLHIPSNEDSKSFLSHKEFSQMKKGVILINTARGDLIDVKALLKAVVEGSVGGVGLDVLPEEPLIREEAELLRTGFIKEQSLETLLTNHVLTNLRNVIITPHNAFNTKEAVCRILETTVQNIESYLNGSAQNVIVKPSALSSS